MPFGTQVTSGSTARQAAELNSDTLTYACHGSGSQSGCSMTASTFSSVGGVCRIVIIGWPASDVYGCGPSELFSTTSYRPARMVAMAELTADTRISSDRSPSGPGIRPNSKSSPTSGTSRAAVRLPALANRVTSCPRRVSSSATSAVCISVPPRKGSAIG